MNFVEMKRSLLLALFSAVLSQGVSAQDSDPVAFLINGEEVTKSQFEYIYHKNNSNNSIEKKSLEEYVDLFVNFKLKVAQAKDLWYDHSNSFKNEFEQYEAQLSLPYFRDTVEENLLLEEAYERNKYTLNVSHILVNLAPTELDTSAAYSKINDLYAQLTNGASFSELASANSDCASSKNGGLIGNITAFSTVYPFESVAYATPVGAISKPFRTNYGYHILKVNSKSFNVKDLSFSQILLSEDQKDVDKLAAKLCKKLNKNGSKFADYVKEYSVDQYSNTKEGKMGLLSENMYLPPFFVEKLKSVAKPDTFFVIKTMRGTHIVCINEILNPTFDELKAELKDKTAKSNRGITTKEDAIRKLKQRNGYLLYESSLPIFYDYIRTIDPETKNAIVRRLNEPLYEYRGITYPQEVFHSYLSTIVKKVDVEKMKDNEVALYVNELFNQYVNDKIWEEECSILQKENPDYRNLLNEYRDGLLLFEISSSKVWNKAAKDKAGLTKYFEEHKSKYTWDSPRYKGCVVRCADQATLNKVNELLVKMPVKETVGKGKMAKTTVKYVPMPLDSVSVVLDRELNKDGVKKVKVVKGLFPKGANPDVDALAFEKKKSSDDNNAEFPFVTVTGKMLNQPETFLDVKGPVTADYQNYLEEQWILDLHDRYPVKKFKSVINTIK